MLYRNFKTQDEIDRQYNAEQAVADFKSYARTYVDESIKARAQLKCDLDVPYGATLDEHLDIFHADVSSGKAPIVIFIHGGYWRRLSSKEFSCVAFGPVANGVHLLNVNYALAPKAAIGEITRQIRASVVWAWRHAESFGGDRERIYLAGHSAGGHLAAMALLTDWQGDYGLDDDIIKGAFLFSGLYDLSPLRYSFLQPALQLSGDDVSRYSPQFHLRVSPARIVVTAGGLESEEFHRQSQIFLQGWQQCGNSGEFFPQEQCNHYDEIYGFRRADSDLCRKLFELMDVPQPVKS